LVFFQQKHTKLQSLYCDTQTGLLVGDEIKSILEILIRRAKYTYTITK